MKNERPLVHRPLGLEEKFSLFLLDVLFILYYGEWKALLTMVPGAVECKIGVYFPGPEQRALCTAVLKNQRPYALGHRLSVPRAVGLYACILLHRYRRIVANNHWFLRVAERSTCGSSGWANMHNLYILWLQMKPNRSSQNTIGVSHRVCRMCLSRP